MLLLAIHFNAAMALRSLLSFSGPIQLPYSCPSSLCRFGGSTSADSFHSFAGCDKSLLRSQIVIGAVNRTVVSSNDGGSTWHRVEPGPSALGPGLLFPNGSILTSTGNTASNQTGNNSTVAVGSEFGRWSVGKDHQLHHTLVAAKVTWDTGPRKMPCLLSGYSGKVVNLNGVWIKTMVVKEDCTPPPRPGWGSRKTASIWLFASDNALDWRFRSVVAVMISS